VLCTSTVNIENVFVRQIQFWSVGFNRLRTQKTFAWYKWHLRAIRSYQIFAINWVLSIKIMPNADPYIHFTMYAKLRYAKLFTTDVTENCSTPIEKNSANADNKGKLTLGGHCCKHFYSLWQKTWNILGDNFYRTSLIGELVKNG
jgi:hypothetical protein